MLLENSADEQSSSGDVEPTPEVPYGDPTHPVNIQESSPTAPVRMSKVYYLLTAMAKVQKKYKNKSFISNIEHLGFYHRTFTQNDDSDISLLRMTNTNNSKKQWGVKDISVDDFKGCDVLDDLKYFANLFCCELKGNKYWFKFFDGC